MYIECPHCVYKAIGMKLYLTVSWQITEAFKAIAYISPTVDDQKSSRSPCFVSKPGMGPMALWTVGVHIALYLYTIVFFLLLVRFTIHLVLKTMLSELAVGLKKTWGMKIVTVAHFYLRWWINDYMTILTIKKKYAYCKHFCGCPILSRACGNLCTFYSNNHIYFCNKSVMCRFTL